MHTYFTPARFTPAKPPAAQQPSPPQHGSFQHWLHLEGGCSRAWHLLPRASQSIVRCGSWFRSCKCACLVSSTPRNPDPFIHPAGQHRTALRHSRHPPADPYRDATAARGSHAASPLLCIVQSPRHARRCLHPPVLCAQICRRIIHRHPVLRRFPFPSCNLVVDLYV
jgi:hypothetical protein